MIHLAAAIASTLALLAALVALHVMVQLSWTEIVAALRGELGLEIRRPRRAPGAALPRRRAAF